MVDKNKKCLSCGASIKGKGKTGLCRPCAYKKRRRDTAERLPLMIHHCSGCGKPHQCMSQTEFNERSLKDTRCKPCTAKKQFAEGRSAMGHGLPVKAFWSEKYGEEEALRREGQRISKMMETRDKWSPELKEKVYYHNKGKPGSTKGCILRELYLSKYGEEEGSSRYSADMLKRGRGGFKQGALNPQFGKPPRLGSGNGWSGHYKGWYFRSIYELSFMIHYIEALGISWRSAETASDGIGYTTHEGKPSTYFADFVLNGELLAEIKPFNLIGSIAVRLKAAAATAWCEVRGLSYKIFTEKDFQLLSSEELKGLHDSAYIRFIDRYEKRYAEKYGGSS